MKIIKKQTKSRYSLKSLGQKLLDRLQGTQTEKKFAAGGQDAWTRYWDGMPENGILVKDEYKEKFFFSLLGKELYDQITEANDYPAEFVIQNAYIAWGRSHYYEVDIVRNTDSELLTEDLDMIAKSKI